MAFEMKKVNEHKRVGRPEVQFRISEEENLLLTKEAADLGLSRSNFVRLCLTEYFATKQ